MFHPSSHALEPSDAWFYRELDQVAAREVAEAACIQRFKDALTPAPRHDGRRFHRVDHWRNEVIDQLYGTEEQITALNNALFDLWENPPKTGPGRRLADLVDEAIEAMAKRHVDPRPARVALSSLQDTSVFS